MLKLQLVKLIKNITSSISISISFLIIFFFNSFSILFFVFYGNYLLLIRCRSTSNVQFCQSSSTVSMLKNNSCLMLFFVCYVTILFNLEKRCHLICFIFIETLLPQKFPMQRFPM